MISFFKQKTLAVNERELCKYFEPGNHVKVVSGSQEGATGMVVKVEQHVLIILSDTTKEHVSWAFLEVLQNHSSCSLLNVILLMVC